MTGHSSDDDGAVHASTRAVPADRSSAFGEVEAFMLGKTALAAGLADRWRDSDRRVRMQRAATQFCERSGVADGREALAELQERALRCDPVDRRLLLVDLWSIDPFSPFEIKVPAAHLHVELHAIGTAIDLDGVIAEIDQCAKDLRSSDRLRVGTRVGGALVTGALVSGGAAFLASRFIGSLVESAPRPTVVDPTFDPAAPDHPSLPDTGPVGARDATLFRLGPQQAQVELRKLELKFAVSLTGSRWSTIAAQRIAGLLTDELALLRDHLDEEQRCSDPRSLRVLCLEKLLRTVEASESWMRTKLGPAR